LMPTKSRGESISSMQLTGGEDCSHDNGSPSGEPMARSRRHASPPAADLGVYPNGMVTDAE
jgi:hypothetical protein